MIRSLNIPQLMSFVDSKDYPFRILGLIGNLNTVCIRIAMVILIIPKTFYYPVKFRSLMLLQDVNWVLVCLVLSKTWLRSSGTYLRSDCLTGFYLPVSNFILIREIPLAHPFWRTEQRSVHSWRFVTKVFHENSQSLLL